MKACFPIVVEKEYKYSTLITKQRQCVFTNLRVESVFISFVSFSFNKPHVSIDIHHWAIPHCGQPQQFNIQKSTLRSAPPCAKKNIRVIRIIRVQNQWVPSPRTKSVWEKFVFKNLVQASKFIIVKSTLRQAATIQHSTFKSQHCAPRHPRAKLFVKFGLFVFKNLVQASWQYF